MEEWPEINDVGGKYAILYYFSDFLEISFPVQFWGIEQESEIRIRLAFAKYPSFTLPVSLIAL